MDPETYLEQIRYKLYRKIDSTVTLTILCTAFNENQRFKAGPDGQWTFNAFNSVEHEFYAVGEYTISIADHTSAIYIYLLLFLDLISEIHARSIMFTGLRRHNSER